VITDNITHWTKKEADDADSVNEKREPNERTCEARNDHT